MLGHPLGPGEGPGQGSGAGAEVLPPAGDISSLALSPTHVPTSLRGIPSWPNTSPCWKVPRAVRDPRLNPAPEPAAPKLPSSPVCGLAAGDSWQPPASQGTGRDRGISDLPRDATDATKFPLAGFVSTGAFTSAAAPGFRPLGFSLVCFARGFETGGLNPAHQLRRLLPPARGRWCPTPTGGTRRGSSRAGDRLPGPSVLRAVLLRRWVGVTPGGERGPVPREAVGTRGPKRLKSAS